MGKRVFKLSLDMEFYGLGYLEYVEQSYFLSGKLDENPLNVLDY